MAIPVAAPIVAMAVLLLVHVPPPVVSVNVVIEPVQTAPDPPIGAALVFTVIVALALHPPGRV